MKLKLQMERELSKGRVEIRICPLQVGKIKVCPHEEDEIIKKKMENRDERRWRIENGR